MKENTLKIGNKTISNISKTYFIADIAANHDGDIQRAKSLIYKAAECGADAAKFQHFQAKSIVSDFGFKQLKLKSHQATWKKSVFEVYNDASVDLNWTIELVNTCKKAGIHFFTTPYSLEIVDYIDPYVPAYKIGSGDITWIDMIKKISQKNKPFFLATGASNLDEVKKAVSVAYQYSEQFCLMQCNTNYTANIENFKFINLNVLKTYKEIFPQIVLGLSDHTPEHSTVLGAVALGARVIEKHFTDDNNRNGPDHLFSMNPRTWKDMVKKTRELELALGSREKKIEDNETETVILQRRSLRTKKKLSRGTVINISDIIPLRPCPVDALEISNLDKIIGKKISRDLEEGDYIRKSDFILK